MKSNKLVAPVLKWVGGKRQLLPEIERVIPPFETYYEPFFGGGAVLFHIQPGKAVVNDINAELMNLYRVVKDRADELIADLGRHKNEADYFYQIREMDRDKEFYRQLSPVEKASRMIYLNKTCYNGLFRVNRAGEFNTPFGNYKKPNIVNESTIRAVSAYLNQADVALLSCDFDDAVRNAGEGAFVYIDPPYDPVSSSANFTGYDKGGFNREEQIRLKEMCDRLHDSGAKFLLSNSATDFIKELYGAYKVNIIKAKRAINSVAEKRGSVDEVLVRNYA